MRRIKNELRLLKDFIRGVILELSQSIFLCSQRKTMLMKMCSLSLSFFFFFLFMPAPVAYGISWARGRIGATGLYHSHSNIGSELHLQPTL